MKITRSQLKEIIKEELLKLQEYGGRPYGIEPGREKYNVTGDAPPGPPMDLGPPPAGRPPIGGPGDEPDADRNKEELVSDLFRRLRDALEVGGLHDDEIRSAVEEALNAALSLNPGEVMAHAGLASDRYEREERAIRRAGPKGPMSPEEHAKYMSLYDED